MCSLTLSHSCFITNYVSTCQTAERFTDYLSPNFIIYCVKVEFKKMPPLFEHKHVEISATFHGIFRVAWFNSVLVLLQGNENHCKVLFYLK